MLDVEETPAFKAWREALPDDRARSRIAGRIARVALGLLGDAKSVGVASANCALITAPDTDCISPDGARPS